MNYHSIPGMGDYLAAPYRGDPMDPRTPDDLGDEIPISEIVIEARNWLDLAAIAGERDRAKALELLREAQIYLTDVLATEES